MNKQQVKSFEKGLYKDGTGYHSANGTYIDALNLMIVSKEKDSESGIMQISNEYGNVNTVVLDSKWKVLGHTIIYETIVLLLVSDNESEIGIVENNVYTPILNEERLYFNSEYQADVKGRKRFDGDRVIYWTDNLNEPRAFNIDLYLRGEYTGDIIDNINLFNLNDVSYVEILDVVDSGNLKAGSYQFAVRYLNENLDYGTTSLVSKPVPIVDDKESSSRNLYDGATYGTLCRKTIQGVIKNIDQDFKYLELLVIRYEGQTTTPFVDVVKRIEINNNEINFSYSGNESIINQSNEFEINQQAVIYETAKCIEAFKNRLFLSNLKTKEYADLQSEVVKTVVTYDIEDMEYDESINVTGVGVNNDNFVTTITGNKNDYKDPVKCYDKSTYMRGEVYALGVMFIYNNGYISPVYHIPAEDKPIDWENISRADEVAKTLGTYHSEELYTHPDLVGLGNVKYHVMPDRYQEPLKDGNNLKLIKLKFNLDALTLPSEIVGYIPCYKERTNNNKSIVASGVVLPLFDKVMTPFDKPPVDVYSPLSDGDYTNPADVTINTQAFAYYSPDVFLTETNPNADYLEWIRNGVTTNYVKERGGSIGTSYRHMFHDTDLATGATYTPYNMINIEDSVMTKDINKTLYVNGEWSVPLDEVSKFKDDTKPIYSLNGTKFLALKGDVSRVMSSMIPVHANLRIKNNNLYGNEYSGNYIPIGVSYDLTEKEFLKGDTIISKYSYNQQSNNTFGVGFDDNANNQSCIRSNDGSVCMGIEQKELYYFFVESQINCNYRHQAISEDNSSFGIPYFPKETVLSNFEGNEGSANGVLDFDNRLGNSLSYNFQYSLQNNIVKYTPINFGFKEVVTYPNRTIYSEFSFDNERSDRYRKFLANSYQDISSQHGEIWDSITYNNQLLLITPKMTFRTFVNEREALASNLGDVYTGTGGVFNSPAQELFECGTLSQWATKITPYGLLIVDNVKSRLFIYTDRFEEISQAGMWQWFYDNININYKDDTTEYVDNPINGKGFITGYDNQFKRLLITNLNDNSYTISYSPLTKAFVSFHSYIPSNYIEFNKELLTKTYNIEDLWLHSANNLNNTYYNSFYESILQFVINEDRLYTKTFLNLTIDEKGNIIPYGIDCETEKHNSTCEVILNIPYQHLFDTQSVKYARKVRDEIRFPIPRQLNNVKLRGKYLVVKFKYNTDQHFILNLVKSNYRIDQI